AAAPALDLDEAQVEAEERARRDAGERQIGRHEGGIGELHESDCSKRCAARRAALLRWTRVRSERLTAGATHDAPGRTSSLLRPGGRRGEQRPMGWKPS